MSLARHAPALGPPLLLALCAAACAGAKPPRARPLPPPLPGVAGPAAPGRAGADGATDAFAAGSGPIELSVEEAAVAALRHNRDLRVQMLGPEIRGAFTEIARGRFDPELVAGSQLTRGRSVETARSTGALFDVKASAVTSSLGVRQQLPTGTTIEASIQHDYNDSSRTPAQHDARIGLSLTQALLQGLGPAVNLAAVEQAELDVQASRYELRGYAQAILAQTEIAYWQYVLAVREIAIYAESLSVARRQRAEIEQEIEVGTMAQTESAAARAEVAVREQDLIDARSVLEQHRLSLLRLLGADLGRGISAVSDPSIEPEPISDLDQRLALAGRSRPEINEARLRLEQQRLETVMTRDGLLPRLDLFVQLGKTGYAGSFSGAFGHLREDTYDVLSGVSFSYFLGNRAADGADRAAVASHRQAELALDNLRQLVRLQVRLAVTEAERARQQIAASAATRALQEQKVMAEQERFRVGESTALILAQAQRDLLSSRIAEVEALVDYRLALVQLYLAEGTLLERRGIRLDH